MSHLLITLLLGPILLIQGLIVRRKTIVLSEPDGSRQGQSGTGQPLKVLIVGDSAAAGVGVDHQNKALLGQLINHLTDNFCVSWQLEAITGATTQSTIKSLENLQNSKFDVVVTSLGVNDVTSNISLSKWLQQQNTLQRICTEKFNTQLVIVTALPPMGQFPALPQPLRWYLGRRSDQFNQSLENQVLNKSNIHYMSIGSIDDNKAMASDGFHPGAKVYQQWAIFAAEKIKSEFLN